MSTDVPPSPEAPVVIAGGGLVGLSTAMFLAQHGVASTVLERLQQPSPLPRAAHFHLRTLELFRLAGIEEEVKAQSEHEFLPEGAIVMMDCLAGRKLADIIPALNDGVEEVSPCRRLFVSQPGLEPILRARAEEAGAVVLPGLEVSGVAQDADGVTVTARDVEGGVREVRGQYLVAADGAHSAVREQLGIAFEGRGAFSNSLTIYFTADLAPQLLGRPLSVIYVSNPTFGGFFRLERTCQSGFLVVNTVGEPGSPGSADAASDTTEGRLVELVRVGAGVADLDVRIDGIARWRATAEVAERYQDGRAFLVGDAAHVMPPNGGFGGNTGIHDAHNLAWKLAAVLAGQATPALLDTYDAERRPVGHFTVEQAFTRYVRRTAPYLGVDEAPPLVPDLDIELGYRYRSGAVIASPGDEDTDGDATHGDPRESRGRPGTRLPHIIVDTGDWQGSTIDLTANRFTVLAGPDGGAWCDAAAALAAVGGGMDLAAHRLLGPTDDLGISRSGSVLVRPDGFVGWRADALPPDPRAALGTALRSVLRAST